MRNDYAIIVNKEEEEKSKKEKRYVRVNEQVLWNVNTYDDNSLSKRYK